LIEIPRYLRSSRIIVIKYTSGEVLLFELLNPLGISAYRLSKDLNIPQTRISQIIKEKRRVTADTALRLSAYFGNSPGFWPGMQNDYDIEEEMQSKKAELSLLM
jgi:antitoxin HigA-1